MVGSQSQIGALQRHSFDSMTQPALPFQRITTDEWREKVAALAAEPRPPAPPPKRPVGRPKRLLSAHDVLAAAAATIADEPPLKKTRGTYTEWFSSPYIHDILREYEKDHRPALAIKRLQEKAPDDRYARLTHTTLMGWYTDGRNLKPHFQAWLDSGLENVRQNGFAAVFESEPAVEIEIQQTLRKMRAAGAAVNSRIIRWVMQGVITLRTPQESRLRSLKLTQTFISAWARKNLKWSWRKSTTAASKLPLDWEEKGLQMAMRIAATMEMKEVSTWCVVETSITKQLLICLTSVIFQGSSISRHQYGPDRRASRSCSKLDLRRERGY